MGAFKRQVIAAADRRRRPALLGTLAERQVNVFCWCNRCGHNAVLPTVELVRQIGPAIAVPEIGAKLRCTGCGSKDVATRPDWPSQGQITRHD